MTNDAYRKLRGTHKPFRGSEEQARAIWNELIRKEKRIFTIARLDGVFDFVKDKFAALAHLQPDDTEHVRAHLPGRTSEGGVAAATAILCRTEPR